jgi:hypothetical protein
MCLSARRRTRESTPTFWSSARNPRTPRPAGRKAGGAESDNAMKVQTDKHLNRWKLMVEYQEKIHPFPPTVRELQKLWGLNTTSAAHLTLNHLIKMGLVLIRWRGTYRVFFAKKEDAP